MSKPINFLVLKQLVLGIFLLLFSSILSGQKSPNVIVIMTDDQGYGDISAHGNPILKTPNLDKLYNESVRFTDFHVNSFCAPTRAALMTGRMSDRTHVTTTINLRNHLNRKETTMAEFFKATGYSTALFGKWHLGSNYPYRPIDRGFDQWVGHGDGGTGTSSDYWANDRMNDTYYRNGEWEKFEGFSTDIYFNEVYKFIQQNKNKPFFVYLPTNVPHGPWPIVKEWRKPYEDKKLNLTEDEIDFFATITHFDQKLGELRGFLKKNNLEQNTILLFLSDNGTHEGYNVYNANMRGMKGSAYEGGHRVPLFIHWPERGLNKGKDINEFVTHTDLLPTLIELCNLKTPQKGHFKFDGRSLSPLLFEKNTKWPDRTFFSNSQNAREVPEKGLNSLVATKDWRLIDGKELYQIKKDPTEKNNVASQFTEVVKDLNKKYDDFWNEIQSGYYPYPRPIIGAKEDTEIWLTPDTMVHDHARQKTAMQDFILSGTTSTGFWPIEVKEKGLYNFEIRRWPKEINHPLSASLPKSIDLNITERGLPVTMKEGKSLDIKKILIRVGDAEKEQIVSEKDTYATFKLALQEGPTLVRAWFIDSKGKESGAYYVYIGKE